jgi:signal transduction histidine kinase
MLAVAVAGQFLGMAVTERRDALAVLQEREEQLQEALRLASASEMYSAIAHELNQPLAAVSHFAWAGRKILDKSPMDKNQLGNLLDSVLMEARRAGAVTQRLRDLYLGGVVHAEMVDLNALIHSAISDLSARLSRRSVALDLSLPDRPVEIAVDPLQITAVLHNIVSNGIEALTGERPSVTRTARKMVLSVKTEKDVVIVAIDDNGPGIAEDMQDRVFGAFATDKINGLGLGLAICRSIIEAHGGRIWAESSRLGGARFCFSLPLKET